MTKKIVHFDESKNTVILIERRILKPKNDIEKILSNYTDYRYGDIKAHYNLDANIRYDKLKSWYSLDNLLDDKFYI